MMPCAFGTVSRRELFVMKKWLFVSIAIALLCKIEAQTPAYDLEIGGLRYNIISLSDLTLCAVGMADTCASTLEIPETVEYGGRTFSVPRVDIQDSYESVENVILPENLEYLFIGGCNAEELHLNAKVLEGFNNCQKLRRLFISPNTTQISYYSFRNCEIDKLVLEDGSSVLHLDWSYYVMPFTTSSIDTLYCGRNLFNKDFSSYELLTLQDAFSDCGISVIEYGSFVDAIYGWMLDDVKNLNIPENVVQMRYFWSDSLENISINNPGFEYYKGIPGHCPSNHEPFLANCKKLDSVYTNIANSGSLFHDLSCKKFVLGPGAGGFVYLPNTDDIISVTGEDAYVMVYKIIPLATYYPVFTNETYLYTPLFVPRGTKTAYQSAEGWRNFFNIIEFDWDISINVLPNNSEFGIVEGSGDYNYGELITIKANPNNGFHFLNWTENGEVVCSDRVYTFRVERNRTLIANFAIGNIVHISANSNNPEFGIIEGAGDYSYGETVTLRAIPNTGCSFQSWTENGAVVCSESIYSFVAENNRDLMANFGGTGIGENEESSKVFVFANGNVLFVEGVDESSEVTVYNVQGQCIYKGLGKKICVPCAGLYIVAAENRKIKVIVE